jgi:hypothetical protein
MVHMMIHLYKHIQAQGFTVADVTKYVLATSRRALPGLIQPGRTASLPAQHDLAASRPPGDGPQCPSRIGERIRLDRRISQRPALPQLHQLAPQLGYGRGPLVEELP